MHKLLLVFGVVLISLSTYGGKGSDSLRAIIYSNQPDTSIIHAANSMAVKYEFRNPDTCLFYGQKALKLATKVSDEKQIMISHYSCGLGYYMLKEYNTCISHCESALEISGNINDSIYEGVILYKLSRAYSKIARYDLTIKTQLEAIRYYEKTDNPLGIGAMYNNMSIAYKYLGDNREAIKALKTALKFYRISGDSLQIYIPYLNIGDNYLKMGVYDSSRLYLDSAIYYSKIYNKSTTTEGYVNYWIGEIYYEQKNYNKALEYFKNSHAIRLEYNDIDDQTYTYLGIGKTLVKLGKQKEALKYLEQAIENAKKANARKRIMMSHSELAELYYTKSDYKNSIFHLKKYLSLKDSIFNDEKAMAIMSARTKFDVENKEKEIELLNMKNVMAEKNKKLQDAELQENKTKQLLLYLGLSFALIAIAGLFFVIKKRNQTNKILNNQKVAIEKSNKALIYQKQIVEEKNKEITDSIQYAKRIQSAILPPNKVVKEYLQESFIYYKPKDIVAGDFYWLESVAPKGKNDTSKILFAAADCTGHGVPGAMVSVVCNNGLNRSVREYGLIEPGEILDKTREIVVEEFEKSEEEVKDGMDIALCCLEGNTLKYAGAHNPLWIIRGEELIEVKANKQPIGQFDNPEPYTTHTIELQKGDSIYIFSDGYADQFGGEKGKKLKTTNFKRLLLSIQKEPMQKQRDLIDKAFEKWKGNLEQLDDVCIIGVRI